jgi:nitrite reductase/ring-hydroxylating ferredoxin subunit
MSHLISRRQLLAGAALAAGGGCLCQAFGSSPASRSGCCSTPDLERSSYQIHKEVVRVDLTKASSLQGVPSAAYLVDPERELQMIIVHSGRKKFQAVSRLCTHAQQLLSFIPERQALMCNGFNHSLFYLDGRLAKGPAETPLQSYACVVRGGVLEITI